MRILSFSLLLFSLVCCNQQTNPDQENATNEIQNVLDRSDTLNALISKTYKFPYDNSDPTKFGADLFGHGLPIGQPSLVLDGNNAYVTDCFHNNIKKVNLVDGSITTSEILSNKRIWLFDIITFNNQILVSSELDTVYVFDDDLKLMKRKFLKKGRGSFVKYYKTDSLILFYPESQEYICVNRDLEKIKERKVTFIERGRELYFKNNLIKKVTKNHYKTKYGILIFDDSIFFNDVAFDSLNLVKLNQDSSGLAINIFKIVPTIVQTPTPR